MRENLYDLGPGKNFLGHKNDKTYKKNDELDFTNIINFCLKENVKKRKVKP